MMNHPGYAVGFRSAEKSMMKCGGDILDVNACRDYAPAWRLGIGEVGTPSQKVSVLLLTESLGPGGAERQLVELARRIDRKRFDLRVLTYFPNMFYRGELDRLGVAAECLNRLSRLDFRIVGRVARWLMRGDVHVVHSFLETANLYAVLARKLAGCGGVIVSELSCHEGGSRLFWLRKSWIHKHADVTVANNLSGGRIVEARAGLSSERVRFIPNMIDETKYCLPTSDQRRELRAKLGWGEDEKVVLTVGTFSTYKNHRGIAEAMAGLSWPSPLRFCWVGAEANGELGQSVQAKLRSTGLNARTRILSLVPRVEDYYMACDVFLLNSIQEGSPNVVLEALACGCPAILTNVSDMSRYVVPGQTGWLIPPRDPASLRRSLEEVQMMPLEKLWEMGVRGRRHFETLGCSPSEVITRYETLYDELVRGQ